MAERTCATNNFSGEETVEGVMNEVREKDDA
jgi:hypothetical protein